MSGPRLRPFFSFYGGKWRAYKKYPAPSHTSIIEPFAGSAGYSTRYPDRNVTLYEADPVIAGVWDYLIHTPEPEIRRLPIGDDLWSGDFKIPVEAQNLIGFWLNHGTTRPSRSASAWMRAGKHDTSFWGEAIRERIASQVQHIRHWTIRNESYANAVNRPATWFIDPPYQTPAGRHYRLSDIDYEHLGKFCQERHGQVIVCEQQGAEWLPFRSIGAFKSTLGQTKEVTWP
jgi:site-specific DNA-adenine methylase